MATKSFTTNQNFSKKSAGKLLKAIEKAESRQDNDLTQPNNVRYVSKHDEKSFANFLKKTLDNE